jgi:hypothetical protein
MPLQILELPKQFRPATSITYPPFKNGRYMEEYFYEYALSHKLDIETQLIYIPVYWTNLQNHPAFKTQKHNYNLLLQAALKKIPHTAQYFTVVQHDDGPQLSLPQNTIVFGACTGTIPLPLIYEDTNQKLSNAPRSSNRRHLASFIGSSTHPLRNKMKNALRNKEDIYFNVQTEWSSKVPTEAAQEFIDKTVASKFCLAPRGYGRSSFRFFEAMLLDAPPVYFWDDIEWLPYKDILDYSKFSVSIQETNVDKTYEILKSISDEKYQSMVEELSRVRSYFTLEGMAEYIKSYLVKY